MPEPEDIRPGMMRRRRRVHLRAPLDVVRPPGYRRAAGDWIYGLAPWTAFATLTFSNSVTDSRADAAFYAWARATARLCRQHVTVAFASDYQSGGFVHFHALLAVGSREADPGEFFKTLDALWRRSDRLAGWTNLQPYDPKLGAAWYLPEHREVGAGVACSRCARCRRKAGCRITDCPL
jgi:hypothetical protein